MNAEPFSYAVVAKDIPPGGRHYRIEADETQRRAVAQRLAIPGVEALSATLRVQPVRGQSYTVRGTVTATVTQSCVVTLEDFSYGMEEEVEVTLMPAEALEPRQRNRPELVDALDTEGPELFSNGRIDLGVIATEHLALGLDPYPHAPGVSFEGHVEDDAAPSPFAALASLKDQKV